MRPDWQKPAIPRENLSPNDLAKPLMKRMAPPQSLCVSQFGGLPQTPEIGIHATNPRGLGAAPQRTTHKFCGGARILGGSGRVSPTATRARLWNTN